MMRVIEIVLALLEDLLVHLTVAAFEWFFGGAGGTALNEGDLAELDEVLP